LTSIHTHKHTNTCKDKERIKEDEVYMILRSIEGGKVTTYGDIARHLGMPNQSRMIGKILNNNKNPINIPCHRVVKTNGSVGGYKFGTEFKKMLLKREGIDTNNKNKVIDFQRIREDLKDPHNDIL
jgi:methylated-DNA-[protein]-cysteine S-methyltransferase